MDPFSAVVGLVWMVGGVFFILAPRMAWYRRRLEKNFGERTADIVDDRSRWYRTIGYVIGLIGLVRLVTA